MPESTNLYADIVAAVRQDQQQTVAMIEQKNAAIARLEKERSDLEEKLETLEAFVEYLSTWRPDGGRDATEQASLLDEATTETKDLNSIDAAIAVLEKTGGKWLLTNTLIRRMQAIGFKSGAANVYTSVFGSLNRAAKRPGSRLVKREGGTWGLRDWVMSVDDDREVTP